MSDVIYRAEIKTNGKPDEIDFYNQSFEVIGRQLDIIKNIYNHEVVSLARIPDPIQ